QQPQSTLFPYTTLFRSMTDRAVAKYLEVFLERHPVKQFKKGEIIIFQGEAPRSAFVVKSGTVKAYNLSVGGDEKPVAFYDAGSEIEEHTSELQSRENLV